MWPVWMISCLARAFDVYGTVPVGAGSILDEEKD